MTKKEKIMFQKGFKVAVNFLFHHHLDDKGEPDVIAQENFKKFLLANIDVPEESEIIDEAIAIRNTMDGGGNCGAGYCPDGSGGCVVCAFGFAFDGTFHS